MSRRLDERLLCRVFRRIQKTHHEIEDQVEGFFLIRIMYATWEINKFVCAEAELIFVASLIVKVSFMIIPSKYFFSLLVRQTFRKKMKFEMRMPVCIIMWLQWKLTVQAYRRAPRIDPSSDTSTSCRETVHWSSPGERCIVIRRRVSVDKEIQLD